MKHDLDAATETCRCGLRALDLAEEPALVDRPCKLGLWPVSVKVPLRQIPHRR